jgi:hypothetical protein
MATDEITISTNHWRIPSPEHAFDGFIEGNPSDEEKKIIVEAAKAARCSWKPNEEALQLVDQMKAFLGCRVRIQFWDPVMWMLEEEGPFPVEVHCEGVTVQEEDGFPQAYLQVTQAKELPNAEGYSPMSYFKSVEYSDSLLAPFSEMYSVTKV